MTTKSSTAIRFAVVLAGSLTATSAAFAQDGALSPAALASSVIYGFIGILFAIIGYKVFEFVLPFDVVKELSEDDNPAVGMVMGAAILGVSIIVAAAIHG